MSMQFTCNLNPARIVFGTGSSSTVLDEVAKLGCRRALVLATPFQKAEAEHLAASLGHLRAGVFAEATMHTPVAITEKAMAVFEALDADCVVSYGGGSTIGLGKAIAWRNDTPQIVVATTYAGSEVTPILGETENGIKVTRRDPRILPEVVIYDPERTLDLPVAMSVSSGLNAMAHAVEAIYAQDRNPITTLQALEGLRALKEGLPRIVAQPRDLQARVLALYGSWLCGTVLGTVGMSLHHKLCHTLGGTFDLPHAETHAILLPHTAAYNAEAAAEVLQPVATLFAGSVGGGLYDFARSLGAPNALKAFGLEERDLDRAADLAATNPYWNPRPIKKAAIRQLLWNAWNGERPQSSWDADGKEKTR